MVYILRTQSVVIRSCSVYINRVVYFVLISKMAVRLIACISLLLLFFFLFRVLLFFRNRTTKYGKSVARGSIAGC